MDIPLNKVEHGNESQVRIIVYDEDLMMDDFVAEAKFKLAKLLDFKQEWVPLYYHGKKAAEILLESKFHSDS